MKKKKKKKKEKERLKKRQDVIKDLKCFNEFIRYDVVEEGQKKTFGRCAEKVKQEIHDSY